MYDRSISPAHTQVLRRRVVRRIHWRALVITVDWTSAHRGAQMATRVQEARERAIQHIDGRGGPCGL